jgi:DNA-binding NarL/FixJ family response regulator
MITDQIPFVRNRSLSPPAARNLPPLTSRENDVLVHLAKGYSYKQIADNLHIGIGTLQGYISNLYQKLRVHSRTEAVVKYLTC